MGTPQKACPNKSVIKFCFTKKLHLSSVPFLLSLECSSTECQCVSYTQTEEGWLLLSLVTRNVSWCLTFNKLNRSHGWRADSGWNFWHITQPFISALTRSLVENFDPDALLTTWLPVHCSLLYCCFSRKKWRKKSSDLCGILSSFEGVLRGRPFLPI